MENMIATSGRELRRHGVEGFPCAAYRIDRDAYPWHWHADFEFVCVLSGSCTYAVASARHELGAGDGILINSNAPHAYTAHPGEKYSHFAMVFDPKLICGEPDGAIRRKYFAAFLQNSEIPGIPLSRDVDWHAEIVSHLKTAAELCFEARAEYEFDVRRELSDAYRLAWRNMLSKLAPPDSAARERDARVMAMMRYIEVNFGERLRVEDVAHSAHISVRGCQRDFIARLGMSPMRYLEHVRLSRAIELLARGENNISEISYACGYQSPGYFAAEFRRRVGVAPRDYRSAQM